ncbi:MAG: endonuclease V [Xanthomonadales bacterium]|nr:endonuclease V [Xanthomonadales bacterium]
MRILATDVHYTEPGAVAAGVLFDDWCAAAPLRTVTSRLDTVEAYAPGAFYRRELPCLLGLLREHALHPDVIVVDGHVFLDDAGRAGLGKHLFDALDGRVPVIGVAKTAFAGMDARFAVLRGDSRRPLYVTAAGLPLAQAQAHVRAMHGAHRVPTLLKAVDRLCRHPG